MSLKTIILAAGEGRRMKSKIHKVLHTINNKRILDYVIDASKKSGIEDIYIVVGSQAKEVRRSISDRVTFVEQKKRLGTAHAVMQVEKYIHENDFVVILCGDTPLIKAETLIKLRKKNLSNNESLTVLTTKIDYPFGYGRIIRDENKNIVEIIEEKEANEVQKKIDEINSGIMCFRGKDLKEILNEVKNNNKKGEYYLTDAIKIALKQGKKVGTLTITDYNQILGINTQDQLEKVKKIINNL